MRSLGDCRTSSRLKQSKSCDQLHEESVRLSPRIRRGRQRLCCRYAINTPVSVGSYEGVSPDTVRAIDLRLRLCRIKITRLIWRVGIFNQTQQGVIVTELDLQPPPLEQHTLLLELHHRVSNEFASAINLISVAAVRTDNVEAKTALGDVVELLHQYADVHRALRVPDRDIVIDAGEYLRTLCRSMSRSKLERSGIRLLLMADAVWLHAERCWRLGMIVHELATNAARHAFDGGNGEISVDLSRAGAFVRCSVSDNGSAPANIKSGRGLRILDDLAESLGGYVDRSFAKGSSFTLVFPFTQNERRASRASRRLARAAQSNAALKEGPHHVQS